MIKRIFDKIEGEIIRELALKGKRLTAEVMTMFARLPAKSAFCPVLTVRSLFTRGETQALVCCHLRHNSGCPDN